MYKTTIFITFLLLSALQTATGNPAYTTQSGASSPELKERILIALEKIIHIREAQLHKATSETIGASGKNLFPALRYALRNSIREYNYLKNHPELTCGFLQAKSLTTESILNQLKNY